MKTLRTNFLVFILSLSVAISLTGLAHAQKRSSLATDPDIEENHVADAMKWLENFRNPEHEANYDSVISNGYSAFCGMDNRPAMKSLSSAAWLEVGKSQGGLVSGRPSAIAFDPSGPIYLAVTTGGLWKTTNNGTDWTSLSDSWKTLAIGGVAVDPKTPLTVYAGTGISSGNIGGSGDISGVGVYKSTDGGLNWHLLDSTTTAVTSQMEVNPANTAIIYRATTGGVRVSTDAGTTWKQLVNFSGATSIVIDPLNPAIVYAAGGGSIEKSIDSGKTWSSSGISGYPTGYLMVLGMSQISSDSIYLSTGNGNGTLALSTNQGQSWTTMSSSVDYLGTQSFYANAMAVDPTVPSIVAVGGLDIYTSNRAGASLKKVTIWTSDPSSSNYAHADIHVLKYNPYTKVLYALTDGGVFYSSTNGSSWKQDMNNNLGTLLFVGGDMAVDPNSNKPLFFVAGAQDNGLNRLTFGDPNWASIAGGDGGIMFASPVDNSTIYGTSIWQNGNGGSDAVLLGSPDGGQNWPSSAQPVDLLANIHQTDLNGYGGFNFYFEYDVADQDPNVVMVCGLDSVYLSTDVLQSFGSDFASVINTSTANRLAGSPAVVHIARANDQVLFIGTSSRVLYHSEDQGQTWTRSTSPTTFGGTPTSITSDPNDATHVFMTVSGTSSKHFYVSTDGGATWTAPATNLPALNYRRVTVDQNGIIYIGSDYGVLRSGDMGVTWYPVADGLPMTMVTMLHTRGNYLEATLYGRGMFYVDLTQLPPLGTNSVAATAANSGISISAIYPSIVSESAPRTNVDYSLVAGQPATLSVYDALGRQSRVLANGFASEGQHEVSTDLSGLTAGTYYMVLTAGGTSITKSFVIE